MYILIANDLFHHFRQVRKHYKYIKNYIELLGNLILKIRKNGFSKQSHKTLGKIQ